MRACRVLYNVWVMTFLLKLSISGIILLFIYAQCRYQAVQFAKQKPINHFGKAAIYGVFVIGLTAAFMHWNDFNNYWPLLWKIPLIGLIERMAFFDLVLSLLRHTPLFYNGDVHPGLKGKSLMDTIENSFPPGIVRLLKIIYIIGFVITIIFI